MNSDNEFTYIISDIMDNSEFNKLKSIVHHGLNRYDHSYMVSYYSYIITKKLRLNYEEATRAALLHDFFFEKNEELNIKNKIKTMLFHPRYAVINSSKYYDLTDLEKDIILTHMFPISLNPPKYLESWIVDIVDDIVSVFERLYSVRKQLSFGYNFLFLLFINYFR